MGGMQQGPFCCDDKPVEDLVNEVIKAGRAALRTKGLQFDLLEELLVINHNQQILIDELSDTVEFQRKMLKDD